MIHEARARGIPPWCLTVFLLTLAAALGADTTSDYTVRVRHADATAFPRVRCIVTVTDTAGSAVSGLSSDEFALSEGDVAIPEHGCTQQRPEKLAVALVIDRSGSMEGTSLEGAKVAATDFVRRMGPSDSCAVLGFASVTDATRTFTSDNNVAVRRIASLTAGGWTALHDAVYEGIELLQGVTADQKAVVALSDGQDNRSARSVADVVSLATGNGVEVYAIGMGEADKAALAGLAGRTGGMSLYTASAADLVNCYGNILGAIATTYELTYDAPNRTQDPPLRTITVRFHNEPHHDEARISYYVPSGLPGHAKESIFEDTLEMFLAGLAGANLLLLAGVLLRRRYTRQAVRRKQGQR